ncbi:DoxX family protein [Acidipropionibacterium virtanenii]|uniref:Inner membrane protein YphA n=1 Tax=Acidipropionibacterium virtanenii TaxID=2057246 RepID=A0A344UUX7_9ACTN|nr:DoxX family protein [Acidipropionibacterium virtanenii]AXE39075.1 hypothetical protein JS278_01919 [Acidipropionibacterium virtanenii]
MSVLKFIARSALAATFINGGIGEFRNAEHMAPAVDGAKEKLPASVRSLADSADSASLVKLDGAVMTAAGAALALGIKPRCAAAVLAAQMIPVTIVGHPFWEAEPEARQGQQIHFFKNLSLAGGLLCIALGGAGKKNQ